jgi:hypothetical protein
MSRNSRLSWNLMNELTVQCPSCGEWFEVSAIGPEDFGSEMDYDCEVC